ncbi:MAG: Trp biosynthesis-associated membrane protein, partial [Actinobacteria bacterium]|nr:Trp biosynthesis-associated membrane protein [Actinomycetota bacterium]
RGSRWPSMGRKYERSVRTGANGADAAGNTGGSGARSAWDALDRGDDPTTWLRDPEQTRQNETDATNGSGRRTRP